MNFRVLTTSYEGPFDLLLFLVRRRELEIRRTSLHEILTQFSDFLFVLRQIDTELTVNFLDIFLQLLELKSRAILGRDVKPEVVQEEPLDANWIEHLIQFREFRYKSERLSELGAQSSHWFNRTSDPHSRTSSISNTPRVEIWDLVQAFGRILREMEKLNQVDLVIDDTPQTVYEERILNRLRTSQLLFVELFLGMIHRSVLVSTFLALLELIKQQLVIVELNNEGNLVLISCNSVNSFAS
jgi:segregation and condensation protein A